MHSFSPSLHGIRCACLLTISILDFIWKTDGDAFDRAKSPPVAEGGVFGSSAQIPGLECAVVSACVDGVILLKSKEADQRQL